MDITQPQIDALEQWAESRRDAYFYKGMVLAATHGSESLAGYRENSPLNDEDSAKTLTELKHEMLEADEFLKEARKILYGGRQGG